MAESITENSVITANSFLSDDLDESQKQILKKILAKILRNILRNPNQSKYYQIKSAGLDKILNNECNLQNLHSKRVLESMEKLLLKVEFQKIDIRWHYNRSIDWMKLWKYYRWTVNNYTYCVPEQMWIKKDNDWKLYKIAIDANQQTIDLLDPQSEQGVSWLECGTSNDKKRTLDLSITSWYDFSELESSEIKWCGVTVNDTWYFRTLSIFDIIKFRDLVTYMNSFRICWKMETGDDWDYVALNPYKATIQGAFNKIKEDLRTREQFKNGCDTIIELELVSIGLPEEIEAPFLEEISKGNLMNNFSLDQIYNNYPNYPNITITWELKALLMVPLERTISVQSGDMRRSINLDEDETEVTETGRYSYNPLLYANDAAVVKENCLDGIPSDEFDEVFSHDQNSNQLKVLFHEVIKNGFMRDLIPSNQCPSVEMRTKIGFDENNWSKLQLDKEILTILGEIKILFHSPIHKKMGYPLSLAMICAIYLYCGKSCNKRFSKDQIQFKYEKWKWFDFFLQNAIQILSHHETREKFDGYLYCGLHGVKFQASEQSDNNKQEVKEIEEGYFVSHVSTSNDLNVAQMFKGGQGCILKFHPSMRRATNIISCDVAWISPHKDENETLFSRSHLQQIDLERLEPRDWNAHIESENETTQVLLLTWSQYDIHYSSIIKNSFNFDIFDHYNIFWILLQYFDCKPIEIFKKFEYWKRNEPDQILKYMTEMKPKFIQRRCWNDQINLFCIFLEKTRNEIALDFAPNLTIRGLPWCEMVDGIYTVNDNNNNNNNNNSNITM